MRYKRPTLETIAQIAGVSKMTVSRALNDDNRTSLSTKKRINEIARELGYQPNLLARNLKRSQTKLIGVIVLIMSVSVSASPATDYTFIREFGQPGAGSNQFLNMDGIAVDRFGNVFVADEYITDIYMGITNKNMCVKRWSVDGQYEHFWMAHQLEVTWPPEGIDCSCDGDPFYVAPVYIIWPYGANIEHTSPNGNLYEKFPANIPGYKVLYY